MNFFNLSFLEHDLLDSFENLWISDFGVMAKPPKSDHSLIAICSRHENFKLPLVWQLYSVWADFAHKIRDIEFFRFKIVFAR